MSGKREVKVVISGDPAGGVGALRKFDSQAAATAEHSKGVSAKIGGAFSKVGSQIGGEFGEIVNRIGEGIDQVGEHGKSLATGLKVAGTAATGIGLALQAAGSKDKQAQDQLKAAIDATGGAWGDYREEVEKSIKTGENYGHTADDTQQAIMKITAATQDPKKAIEDMSLVENLAAAQHVSLAEAAGQVAKVYGGSGRVLKQYGITLESSKVATAALTTAQRQHQSAVDQLAHAQRSLADLEEVDRGKKKLSIGQEIQLRNARDAVKTATEKVKTTTTDLGVAQDKAAKSTGNADVALQQLGKRLDGQASASVDNFSGHIHVLMARADDWVAQMGQRFGPAITATGPLLMTAGLVLDMFRARSVKAALAQASIGTSAESSAARTVAADEEMALANDGATASAGRMKVGALGAATGIAAIGVAGYMAGKKLSDMMESGKASVQVLGNLGHTTDSFTTALVNNGGKLDDQVKGLVQAQIQSSGLADKAARAGITTDALTTAVTGNAQGMQRLIDKWKASGKPSSDTIASLMLLYGSYQKAAQTGNAAADATGVFSAALSRVPRHVQTSISVVGVGAAKDVIRSITDYANSQHPVIHITATTSGHGTFGGQQVGNNAVGTEFWRGGPTHVNEAGPELIDLPRGSAVHPANESSRMLTAAAAVGARAGASGGGDIYVTNIVTLDGAVVHKSLIRRRRDLGGSGLGLD